MAEQKKLNKITSSILGRSLKIAKMSLTAGAEITSFGARNWLSSDANKKKNLNTFLQNQAEKVAQELGELKGSLMKAGQMLSMYGEHFLPPEANQFLKQLQSNSPPLEWEPIAKSLKENLSPEILAQLDIDPNPLGSASLGQAHLATVRATGERLVLKVQYPGVEKAIDSDLRAIKSLLKVLKLIPSNFDSDSLFAEVQEMLELETDYLREAELTESYRQLLANDPRFIVPKVYPQFSNKKILATSFEAGLSPDDPLISALAQNRRDRLATHFIDLYFNEIFNWHLVQTDPHLGNYKIKLSQDGQDQLILLDFGAAKRYPPEFMATYKAMIKGSFWNDESLLLSAAQKLGFTAATDPQQLIHQFRDFCLMTVEPFLLPSDPRVPSGLMDSQGRYAWRDSDLPQRLTRAGYQIVKSFPLRSPPREVLFLDRKTGGVFIFCSVLGAKVETRHLLVPWLS